MYTCKHHIWHSNVIPAASLCLIVDIGLTDVNFDLLSLCLVTLYVCLTNRILLVFAILTTKGLPLSSRFDFYSLGLVIVFAVDILHPILQWPSPFMLSTKSIFQKRSMEGCCIEHLGCLITFGAS